MNRRRFIELLTAATVGSTVAYSFPSIIVPQNLEKATLQNGWPITFGHDWGYDRSQGVYYIVRGDCIVSDGIITIPPVQIISPFWKAIT